MSTTTNPTLDRRKGVGDVPSAEEVEEGLASVYPVKDAWKTHPTQDRRKGVGSTYKNTIYLAAGDIDERILCLSCSNMLSDAGFELDRHLTPCSEPCEQCGQTPTQDRREGVGDVPSSVIRKELGLLDDKVCPHCYHSQLITSIHSDNWALCLICDELTPKRSLIPSRILNPQPALSAVDARDIGNRLARENYPRYASKMLAFADSLEDDLPTHCPNCNLALELPDERGVLLCPSCGYRFLTTPPFDEAPGQSQTTFDKIAVGENFLLNDEMFQRIAGTLPRTEAGQSYYFSANAQSRTPWEPVVYIYLLDASIVERVFQPEKRVELTPEGYASLLQNPN